MRGRGAAKVQSAACTVPPARMRCRMSRVPLKRMRSRTSKNDGARRASASEPPPVRAPWAELTEDERKRREHEQHAREQRPHQPWIELTPDVLRRTVIPEPENPHASCPLAVRPGNFSSRPTPLPEVPRRLQRATFVSQLDACIRVPSVRLPRTMRHSQNGGRQFRMHFYDDNQRASCALPCANPHCPCAAVCGQHVDGANDTHDRHRCSGCTADARDRA